MEPVSVGRYAVGDPLGRGAIGEVRAALDLTHGTPVAVKLLTAEGARRPEAAELFAREVRAVARLNHAKVIRIFDQGVLDADAAAALELPTGSPWFSMERAGGSAQEPTVDWAALRVLLLDLLDALAYCHAREIVHRDLKPQNVLRCGTSWKLADFGLALPLDELEGAASGTPLYMPPEQFDRPGAMGPWSDLYALGVLAWVRATGLPPFLGDVRALHRAHRDAPLPPFDPQFRVPQRFEGWLRRALAKDPSARWDHAASARADLLALGPGPDPRDPRPAPALPARTGLVGVRELPLIGRAAEANALRNALAPVLHGAPTRFVAVEGTAGTGKSFLARHVAREAAEAGLARVLEVHSHPGDDGDGLSELARRLLKRPRCPVDGPSRVVLEQWVDFHTPTPPEADRHGALEDAVERLTRDRPLILVLDDLQWGPEALRWASGLPRAVPTRVLVLATERLEPGSPSVLPQDWTRVRVGGLAPEHAERLAAEVLGEGVRAVQLAEISRGNPLLAVQLALHFVQTGRFAVPTAPVQGWAARLDAVLFRDPTMETPLRLAAVVGGDVPFEEWRALDGRSVAPLIRTGLAEELADHWRLAHPLLVDAIRAITPDGAWRELSGRAADRLADADPLRRARLLLAAGRDDEAADLALGVAHEARERVDPARAHRALDLARACRLSTPARRDDRDVAEAYQYAWGQDHEPMQVIAHRLASTRPGTAAHLLGLGAQSQGDIEAAAAWFARARMHDPDDHRILHSIAYVAIRQGRHAEAREAYARLAADATTAWQSSWVERRLAHLACVEGNPTAGLRHAERAEALALDGASPGLAGSARQMRAEILLLLGRAEEAMSLAQEELARRAAPDDPSARMLSLYLGIGLLETGHPERAGAIARSYLDGEPDALWSQARTVAAIVLGRVGVRQGDPSAVRPALDLLADAGPSHAWPPELRRQVDALERELAHEPELRARLASVRG